jgi:peptidoglycan/LPS O-acetylase OafA/YrhL
MNASKPKPAALPMLTAMRGVAALLVFHMHFAACIPALTVLSRAYLSVDFFFVLSGFVLTHVYRDWFSPRFQQQSVRNFFLARFARIYPLQFFASTLYALLLGILLKKWQLTGYLQDIFLINFMPRWHSLNMVSWSIGAECVAYLFAPFLIYWITSARPWRIVAAFLLSAANQSQSRPG